MSLVGAILIVLAADAVAIALLLLVRRRAPEGSYFSDGDRASVVFGLLGAGFAIFAGFVILLAFTSYDQSRAGAEAEATALKEQVETSQFLPRPTRERLIGELVCYGRYVVDQEWPRMEEGKEDTTINPWSVAMFQSLKLAEPASATAQRPSTSGSTRPRPARKPGTTASMGRPASSRRRSGSCCSSRQAFCSLTCSCSQTALRWRARRRC